MKRLAVLLLALPMAANAATITQIIGIDLTSGQDTVLVTPFDPTLGTLERVNVSLDAQISVTGIATSLQPWQVSLGLDAFGLAGNLFSFAGTGISLIADGFDAGCNPTPGGCVPRAAPVSAVGNVSFSFSFTDVAEMIGLNQAFIDSFSVTGIGLAGFPPPTVVGSISDFLPTPAQIYQLGLVMIPQTFVNFTPLSFPSATGSMQISYTFAPPDPQPVPEPAGLLLIAIGLLGLGLARRMLGDRPRRLAVRVRRDTSG